jgi:hypothetical protein
MLAIVPKKKKKKIALLHFLARHDTNNPWRTKGWSCVIPLETRGMVDAVPWTTLSLPSRASFVSLGLEFHVLADDE